MKKIYVIGTEVLRKEGKEIDKKYPELPKLIEEMFETMYQSEGVGLAAPQIGLSIKLFVIDATPYEDDDPQCKNFKKVFINAKILEYSGKKVTMEEGCLSIPGINENVQRYDTVRIQYYDENFDFHDETISGLPARILQHEYDHTYGILFTDRISKLRKTMIRNKLKNIALGKTKAKYPTVLGNKKEAEKFIFRNID